MPGEISHMQNSSARAIESAPEKRLTLAQIYEWDGPTVPYFKDKGDSNSSAGWKVTMDPPQYLSPPWFPPVSLLLLCLLSYPYPRDPPS